MSGDNGSSGDGKDSVDGGDNGRATPAGDPMRAAQSSLRQPLPRRFYTVASVDTVGDREHRLLLDGRPARTPRKALLALPGRPLAEALAAEWEAQTAHVDPAAMPLTRLANTALDGVTGREAEVRADIVKYGGSDLLCYRAEHPAGLVARQTALWDPVLAWAAGIAGAPFAVQRGIMPVAQAPSALAGLERSLAGLGAFGLTAVHAMTTLMGSALLALAVQRRHLQADSAWEAAHVDEDWQIAEWGEDEEAARRRAQRRLEMEAAARMLALLPPGS